MSTLNASKSNQKWVINHHSEAQAYWPTPHAPFIGVADADQELASQFRLHWEPHEKVMAQNIAARLSARLGAKYVVRTVELGKNQMRQFNY